MTEYHSVFPDEILLAPPHPLAPNLDLPIPDFKSADFEEIRAIQQRDRIPGVVKRIIPLDEETTWEYWWAVPGRLLLPEDVQLIESDRDRLETILKKLIWLFGGYCFRRDSIREGEQVSLYDWQEVLDFARKQGFDTYFIDVDFMPTAIKEDPANEQVAVEPAHWHIEFFKLIPVKGGFEIQEPKALCSCQIWLSKPFVKHLKTGETSTHYDLWISQPLDITQPPWLN